VAWNFLTSNLIKEDGVNKKLVRIFDTLGSLFALVGLVIGLTSVFLDQYDLDFEPEGELKLFADVMHDFQVQHFPH